MLTEKKNLSGTKEEKREQTRGFFFFFLKDIKYHRRKMMPDRSRTNRSKATYVDKSK